MVLVSCGAADSRQDALDALERTTAASDLEAQMAGLVESTGLAITPAQGKKLGNEIERIDGEAESVLTSGGDAEYDQQIDTAVEETREAGNQLAVAVEKPGELVTARKKASARLVKSNKNLKQATSGIGKDLADEDGNLSEQDAEALGQTVAAVKESGQAVNEAVESAACSIPGKEGGAFAVKVLHGGLSCAQAVRVFEADERAPETPQAGWTMPTAEGIDWICVDPLPGAVSGGVPLGDNAVRHCYTPHEFSIVKSLPE